MNEAVKHVCFKLPLKKCNFGDQNRTFYNDSR